MAKARVRKLKVFRAQVGFYDTVVAAPSQAAALRAWGIRQDLFASGEAQLATDKAAVTAALEQPEVPLRRAVGSREAFAREPTGLPKVPEAPKRAPAPKARARTPAPNPPAPPPDRSRLDAAEAALRDLDARRKAEEAELRQEEEALEHRRSAAQAAYAKARREATAAMAAARREYRRTGGVD